MTAPGPPGLGRGVIVNVGDPVPAAWAGASVVTIDRATLDQIDAAPGDRSDVVDALHAHWASRTPVVVALGVDPTEFRAPRSLWSDRFRDDPSALAPGLDPTHDRLHFLVWANTYDARGGAEPIWWWGRKALKAGAVGLDPATAGAGDVALPGGTSAWVDGGPRATTWAGSPGVRSWCRPSRSMRATSGPRRRPWPWRRIWRPTSWRRWRTGRARRG